MVRILFAAGGSIGHIAPCIAVLRALQKIEPGTQAHFVCSTRPEDQIFLKKEGVMFTAIAKRVISIRTLPVAFLRACGVLSRTRPDVILAKGGCVTVPVALAGRFMRIPIVVHESDAIHGRATRFIGRFARAICFGFPQSEAHKLTAGTSNHAAPLYTGNPVRPAIMQGSRERGLAITGFSGMRPILLVMGGSQGASAINDAVATQLDALLSLVDVAHITGIGKKSSARRAGRYWSCEFAHEDYPHLLAITDLALSRAGAGAISELATYGIAAMFVPLRGVAHDHQEGNARAAEANGACVVIEQDSLQSALLPAIHRFLDNPPMFRNIRDNIRTMAGLDAGKKLAEILLAISHEHGAAS